MKLGLDIWTFAPAIAAPVGSSTMPWKCSDGDRSRKTRRLRVDMIFSPSEKSSQVSAEPVSCLCGACVAFDFPHALCDAVANTRLFCTAYSCGAVADFHRLPVHSACVSSSRYLSGLVSRSGRDV